jgi:dTDP-4-dehydrorhamnose reductase
MLGTDLCQVLGDSHEVTGCDIDDFDIVNRTTTHDAVVSARPEVVVHLAAFTDVEACESERSKAFECNAIGSMNIASAAREAGANLVYLSTDYVFDGTKSEPYVELDQPRPLNFYGVTKLYGEYYAETLTAKHLIVRTSWLFGPNGSNFVDKIVGKASQGGPLRVVNDQRGCPTYTMDLAKGMKQVIETGLEGIVHLSNSGEATWFDLAKHAVAMAGMVCEIEPVSSGSYTTKAVRPRYSVLGSLVLENIGFGGLPPWRDAVREHLARKGTLKESRSS